MFEGDAPDDSAVRPVRRPSRRPDGREAPLRARYGNGHHDQYDAAAESLYHDDDPAVWVRAPEPLPACRSVSRRTDLPDGSDGLLLRRSGADVRCRGRGVLQRGDVSGRTVVPDGV